MYKHVESIKLTLSPFGPGWPIEPGLPMSPCKKDIIVPIKSDLSKILVKHIKDKHLTGAPVRPVTPGSPGAPIGPWERERIRPF